MTPIYFLLSVSISWIWVEYFRFINVDDYKKKIYIYLIFILGGLSFYLFHKVSPLVGNSLNNDFVLNVINSIVKVGLLGELIKSIPILFVYFIFRKQLTDPINVFVFFTISSLGFVSAENYLYSLKNEFYVVNSNTILASLNEMFCSAIIAYGIIEYIYIKKYKKPLRIILFLILAAILHGIYDLWSFYESQISYSFIATSIYFMLMTSIFINTLTSSINISSDFSYGKKMGNKESMNKIFKYFAILIIIQFLILAWYKNFLIAFKNTEEIFLSASFIIFIVVKRLNKIKPINGRWNTLKIELPFKIYKTDSYNGRDSHFRFVFKGETFNEEYIDKYYNDYCSIFPLSNRNSFIVKSKSVFIINKFFLKNDETFYLIKNTIDEKIEYFLLKPKNSGKLLVKRKYPIAALFSIHDIEDIKNNKLNASDFQFREWVIIKHR